jgi:hypothetical protein
VGKNAQDLLAALQLHCALYDHQSLWLEKTERTVEPDVNVSLLGQAEAQALTDLLAALQTYIANPSK